MKNDDKKGFGPHKKPWPAGEQYDSELVAHGDRRNVIDKYRYWTVEAIKQDMIDSSFGLEVAIENYEHDFNIGTIVRNCNAFNVRKLHIIGSRQWNKRGAMMTDKYLEIVYHKESSEFLADVAGRNIVVIDNKPGSSLLSSSELPKDAIYVFGSESEGVTDEIIAASSSMIAIEQFGSTRSVNVGVASGILMYEWTRRHVLENLAN